MIGEVTCIAKPWTIIPMVVTQVQDVIATGQIRPTDQLVDVQQMARPGTITVFMEPIYQGQLDGLPQGSSCIANAYTNNHDELRGPRHRRRRAGSSCTPSTQSALVHAMILRIQALLLPIQTLVLGGPLMAIPDRPGARLAPAPRASAATGPPGCEATSRPGWPSPRSACRAPSPIRRSRACRRRPASTPASRRWSPTRCSARRGS